MTSELSKKRQRSPSPLARSGHADIAPGSPPPEKKRRSIETTQSPRSAQGKSQSPVAQRLAESVSKSSTGKTDGTVLDHYSETHVKSEGKPSQAGNVSSKDAKSPQSRQSSGVEPDSIRRKDARQYQNGEIDQRPRSPRRDRNGGLRTAPRRRSRTRSPTRRRSPNGTLSSAYRRRDPPPPPRRSRSPSPIRRSPPREDQPTRRPGGGTGRGRNVGAIAQRLAEERERQQEAQNAQIQRERGVQHMSNQFYNSRPEWVKERGRDWRKNESQIKGLRAFNNWIKSCIIQKFSPEEAPQVEELGWGEEPKAPTERKPLLVLDMGCGKGGDLGKWQLAPQTVGLYVGLDPADQSIAQARDRYVGMRRGRKPIFDARFHVKDCFGEWVGDIPIVREVGIDPNAGHGGPSKWSGGGFDVVTMMFSMHYAFESEQKARMMLRNVAGALKKGGRFIGVVPNSDAITEQVVKWYKENKDKKQDGGGVDATDKEEKREENTTNKDNDPPDSSSAAAAAPHWGNSIYTVRFNNHPRPIPPTGIFRDPPFGWKYMYWMSEAVDVPEYVVPWEAFRALAEQYNLEQRYRKPFLEVWDTESREGEMRALGVRMGVVRDGGMGEWRLAMSEEEREAVGFYHAFCFVKV